MFWYQIKIRHKTARTFIQKKYAFSLTNIIVKIEQWSLRGIILVAHIEEQKTCIKNIQLRKIINKKIRSVGGGGGTPAPPHEI